MLGEAAIRIVAACMAAFAASLLVLVPLLGRPGRSAPLRAKTDREPLIIGVGGLVSQLAVTFYPALVAAFPSLTYGTVLQWSFPDDDILQLVGIGLWVLGAALILWSFRFIGRYLSVSGGGVIAEHELVTSGPYARIRHPVYAGVIYLGLGVTLVFQSYLMLIFLGPAAGYSLHRARLEEQVLSSPAGFGNAYRAYMARTGRFFPRLRA